MRYACGLDVSKNTIDAYFYIDGTSNYAVYTNNLTGYKGLRSWLESFAVSPLHVCMEATGNYYEGVADYLGQFYSVSVVNPLKIKNYARQRFARTKTDKQDARLIAEYCQTALDKDLPVRSPLTESDYRLRRLVSHVEYLKGVKVAEQNRLEAAKDLYVKSQLSEHVTYLSKQIKTAKKEIEKHIKGNGLKRKSELLQTIPSVGSYTAAVLLTYLIENKFDTSGQFVAYAGLSPSERQSGISVYGKASITSLGNRKLRSVLYMPALACYRCGYFGDYAKRLKDKNKPAKVILVALMRKIAVIAFNLYKTDMPYDSKKYQSKKAE